jgi:5-methylthioadenosine/S-adenosylhomocysteine deaminase
MSLMRNYADDVPFQTWLFERITPVEDALTLEEAYWGNLLSIMEMIRTGTTTFVDMQMFPRMAVKACAESGMRAMITRGLVGADRHDEGGLRRIAEAFDEMEYGASIGAPVTFGLGPHAIYTCGEDFLRYVTELAREKNLPLNIHLAETAYEYETCLKEHGMTPAAYLDSLGMLDGPILLAHCVYLADEDFALLKKPGVHVVTNPASNMKLANGFAPVQRMLQEGLQVCLGTDSAASNNALNMFTEMRLLTMTQKGVTKEALALTAEETFRIASENGARALGLDAGRIAPGALADLVLLDEKTPSLQPVYSPKSALVYSASGYEVTDVFIGGKPVYENGAYTTIDAERVYVEVEKIAEKYS